MDDRPVTKYAEAQDGVTLSYKVFGQVPLDLVWLSGLAYPADLFVDEPGFAHLAKRLAGFARTIWFEPRGVSASGGHVLDALETMDGDVTSVLDAENCGQAVLVGWGHSGTLGIRYAASHPDRIRSLVLVDTYAHYRREPDYPVGLSPQALEERLRLAGAFWGTGMLLDVLAPSRASDDKLRERIARGERMGLPPDVIVEATHQLCLQDVRDLLPTLSLPVLVVHHEGGRFVTVDAGRYLASQIPGARYAEIPGEDQLFFVGDIDGAVDQIEEFLTGSHQGVEGDVVTTTILFTDIVSSTEQAARMGHRRWTHLTDDHNASVRRILSSSRGREIKTIGDGFLATFDAASRAVRAAKEIVTESKGLGLEVRAGVHVGEVEASADDVVGLPVSIAKRICDCAASSEVFVSEAVRLHLLGSGIELSDRGAFQLKGVPDEWRLFAVDE